MDAAADAPLSVAPPTRPRPRLALLEVLDADGRTLHGHDVQHWPLRLGRALDNDVVLHDPHAAAHHATLDLDEAGSVRLTVGASRNGVGLDGRVIAAGDSIALPPLARWQVGHSLLRLRRLDDPLPQELTLAVAPPPPSVLAGLALAVIALAWQFGSLWLGGNPASGWESYALPLITSASTLGLWVGLWSLASKLFTHRLNLGAHLRVALGYTVAGLVVDAALALAAYMVDLPALSRIRDPVGVLILAAMVAHHLRLVVPAHPGRVRAGVALLALLAVAGQMGLQWQRNGRLFDEPYLSTLPPPALRLVSGRPPAALLDELRGLEAPLAERARVEAERDREP